MEDKSLSYLAPAGKEAGWGFESHVSFLVLISDLSNSLPNIPKALDYDFCISNRVEMLNLYTSMSLRF